MASFYLMSALAAAVSACATPNPTHRWSAAEILVEPSPFNAVQGLAIDHQERLLAASLFGGQLWSIDRTTGDAKVLVDRPEGQSDDIAVSPTGGIAWTSKLEGKVRYRENDSGKTQVLASLPSVNSIGFDPRNGRLYAAQVFGADALWEIDRSGAAAPRLIARDLGGLNSFDVGVDGMIYGPLQDKGMIARIDPGNGRVTVIASGFAVPGPFSLKISHNGDLWIGNHGRLIRLDPRTGRKTIAARFETLADDLAIGRSGEIYISDGTRNAIHVYSPAMGTIRELLPPRIALPAGLDLSDGRLWVASTFVLRSIDLKSKVVREEFHDMKIPFPSTVSKAGGQLAVSSMLLGVVEIFDTERWLSIARTSNLAAPSDAALLDDGSLLYSEYGNGRIVRAWGADFSRRETIASGLNGPVQMTIARNGHLYVTESSGSLKEIPLAAPGKLREVATKLKGPEGLAETPWGSLVVAEVGRRRLVEINPKTGRKSVIADELPIGLNVTSPLPAYAITTGVAVDEDGTIYLSADINNAIYKFRPCQ